MTAAALALRGLGKDYYAVLVRQDTTIADIAPQIAAPLGLGAGFALLGIL